MTVGGLVEMGLAYPGAKIRFEGEDEIVEVVCVGEWCLLDSKGRAHMYDEVVLPIIEPLPNVE